MSKPQLYIKEKGKYKPYIPPEVEVDNKLYRKKLVEFNTLPWYKKAFF